MGHLVKELTAIQKINATKNFNAGAISTTAKRQLLAQKRHMTYRSLRSIHLFFAQLTILPNPPKSYALQYFSVGLTLPKVPLPVRLSVPHVMHVPWTHLTQHPKLHVDWFTSAVFA